VAGALNLYGPALGLPRAYSGQLTNYYWGPPPGEPQTAIAVSMDPAWLRGFFGDVTPAGTIGNAYDLPNEEYGRGVFICRQPRQPLRAAWTELRAYD
jgi:hypothetical protein